MRSEHRSASPSISYTLEDNTVTIRDRDTMEQIRLSVYEVADYISRKLEF